jgi:cytochrome P450
MTAFEPRCRDIAEALVRALPRERQRRADGAFAQPFALRVQCAFMGWPDSLHEPLGQWIGRNHRATRAGDRSAMAQIAVEFDGHIKQQLVWRRDAGDTGERRRDQPAAAGTYPWPAAERRRDRQHRAQLDGRRARHDRRQRRHPGAVPGRAHPALQAELRQRPDALPAAIDEILRLHPPLIANRRVSTCPVEIGGRQIAAGERLTLIWASANRDEAVFGDPDRSIPSQWPSHNLLYGAGVHVCPGPRWRGSNCA